MKAAPQHQEPGEISLAVRYAAVREHSRALIDTLSAEDCQVQSMPDVSPAKWHLAHTSWFFETFLLQAAAPAYRAYDEHFGYLFNSYYNGVGEMHPRPQRGLLSRPLLDEVLAYRAHVDVAMQDWLPAVDDPELLYLIELGLNHEQQHQELMLTDILHVLSCNPLRPQYDPEWLMPSAISDAEWASVPEGLVEIGGDGSCFAFDNEGPRHRYWLAGCRVSNRLVTNGDYLEFVRDGGYQSPLIWTSDGWSQVNAQGWQAPLYWNLESGTQFTLAGEVELNPALPVSHISWYEADAFARWAGARLPTEQEWEISAPKLEQAFGSVWQWTASPYAAYPGFRAATGAVGEYNGKFMCNQFVLRGSSVATPAGHSRITYRNFFYPDARWQFSGLRLARDA